MVDVVDGEAAELSLRRNADEFPLKSAYPEVVLAVVVYRKYLVGSKWRVSCCELP